MASSSAFQDGWYWSRDGLRLHFRDYHHGDAERPALLCLPGLTRNARDFSVLAERYSEDWRIVVAELRGRGDSAYAKDPLTYVPLTYLQDLEALLAAARLKRFVTIGTSLGGMLALMLARAEGGRVVGAVLNDIGPQLEPAGVQRIRGNVGRRGDWPTWLHAARDLATRNGDVHPGWSLTDWLGFAKRLCKLTAAGRIVFDYDARIAEPFRLPGADAGVDLWSALDGLAGKPVLSVRGELSDVLGAATQAAMAARLPGLHAITVPGVGHAPTLAEPVSVAAIDTLLAKVARG